jgi:hypothetical protein
MVIPNKESIKCLNSKRAGGHPPHTRFKNY